MEWLLAHQGGWDEILMFLIPIALAALIIRRLESRRPESPDRGQEKSSEQKSTL